MTRPAIPDPSDDRFDAILDAMLRGDRSGLSDLDPEMASTLDQVLGWADLSGFVHEPPSTMPGSTRSAPVVTDDAPRSSAHIAPEAPIPIRATPVAPETHPHRRASRRRVIMSALSGIAAALVLGLSIYTAIPALNDRTDRTPSPTAISLAGTDGTQLADAGPSPTKGSDTVIGSPGPNADGIDVLTSDECAVAPLSRPEVLSILATPPGDYADVYNSKSMTSQETSFANIPVDDLNAVFREWQACVKFGATWQYMALQTDFMTRSDIYGPQLLSRPALIKGYSESTLNEILDGRVLVDQKTRDGWASYVAGGGSLPEVVLVIDETADPSSISISADGTYIANLPVAKLIQTTGEQFPHGTVDFELVDGQWKIARADTDF
ncbi:MAG: hypothetical protein QM589_14735 [Thermomicrobiales bacterium]